MIQHQKQQTICIIGGGLTGITLALTLAKKIKNNELKIVLIEAKQALTKQQQTVNYRKFDNRSLTLNYATYLHYQSIDLWNNLTNHAQPIHCVEIFENNRFGHVTLTSKQAGLPVLGYIITHQSLGETLLEKLLYEVEQEKIILENPATVTEIKPTKNNITVKIEANGHEKLYHADLVVLADGNQSQLLPSIGITTHQHDYNQSALVTSLCTETPHQDTALEYFTQGMALTLLPRRQFNQDSSNLDQPNRALIWISDHHHNEQLLTLDESAFIQSVQQFFPQIGKINHLNVRSSYPLIRQTALEQIRNHLVILGNVAHTLHPIAAQGYNLTVRDIIALTNTIKTQLKKDESIGSIAALNQYFKKQKPIQDSILLASEMIINSFSYDHKIIQILRNSGMFALNHSGPIKKIFTRLATGLKYN